MDHQPDHEPQSQPQPQDSDAHRSITPDQPVFSERLLPPVAPYLTPSEGTSTPRDSYITSNSAAGLATNAAPLLEAPGEKDQSLPSSFTAKKPKPLYKKHLIWVLAAVALALIATAVVVPVYFTVIKPKNNTVSGGNGSSNGSDPTTTPTHQSPTNAISGGDGSTIKTENGTEFVYANPHGGICEAMTNFLPLALVLTTTF